MTSINSIVSKYDPHNYIYVFYYNTDAGKVRKTCHPQWWFSGDENDKTIRCKTMYLNYAYNDPRPEFYSSILDVLAILPNVIDVVEIANQDGDTIKKYRKVHNDDYIAVLV